MDGTAGFNFCGVCSLVFVVMKVTGSLDEVGMLDRSNKCRTLTQEIRCLYYETGSTFPGYLSII